MSSDRASSDIPRDSGRDVSGSNPLRLRGLDGLRALAAVAVVALHAGIPYMSHPLPRLGWCVLPTATNPFVDALCWAINGCVMPVFFLMGGHLAAGAWQRRPGREFLQHRTRRLLLPLAFAILLVLPADMYIWLAGWVTEGLIPLKKMRSVKLPEPLSTQFWGLAHLWYLACLWSLSVAAWAFLTIRRRWPIRANATTISIHAYRRAPGERLNPATSTGLLGWTIASGVALSLEPEILIGFSQRWWPSPAMLLFYATFFTAGWNWPRHMGWGGRSRAIRRLAAAAVLFLPLLMVLHRHVDSAYQGGSLLALTVLFSLYGWLAATGAFGLACSITTKEMPRPVTFVAEASFWMYLVHHPFVALTQLALVKSGLPAEFRFLIALAIGLWLSLATYAVFVRGRWIERLLNSGRERTSAAPSVPDAGLPIERAA